MKLKLEQFSKIHKISCGHSATKKKPRGFTVLTLTSKKNTETYHRNKSNVSTFFCTLSTQKVTFIDLRVRWRLHSGSATVALTYVLVLYCLVSYSYVPLIEASITLHPVIVRWCYTGTVLCGERAREQIKNTAD